MKLRFSRLALMSQVTEVSTPLYVYVYMELRWCFFHYVSDLNVLQQISQKSVSTLRAFVEWNIIYRCNIFLLLRAKGRKYRLCLPRSASFSLVLRWDDDGISGKPNSEFATGKKFSLWTCILCIDEISVLGRHKLSSYFVLCDITVARFSVCVELRNISMTRPGIHI